VQHAPIQIKKFLSKKGNAMSNKEKYDKVFIESFSVSADQLNDKFVYQCVPAWDSVGHMGMIAALEDAFGIMMETEDIIEFGSYTIGIEKIKKYGVEV
jgi:acyl carrier protein